jgi:hypothetical protein
VGTAAEQGNGQQNGTSDKGQCAAPVLQERLSTAVLRHEGYELTRLPGDRSAVIGSACRCTIFHVPASRRKTSVARKALTTVSSRPVMRPSCCSSCST